MSATDGILDSALRTDRSDCFGHKYSGKSVWSLGTGRGLRLGRGAGAGGGCAASGGGAGEAGESARGRAA